MNNKKDIKIGYTTGVFDLFHIGHLNILKQAKENCDYLIVGVSTDECVFSYKNKIPTIPFNERAAIVEAIKYVDKVVPQKEMDKMKAWEENKYDILFHGDDWKGSKMYDELIQKMKTVGVEVKFLHHTPGISSTILQNKLK